MRLVITSDTHGFERGWGLYEDTVPEGDVFIHCGDYSRDFGSWNDVVRFAQWMGNLPHAHRILCPGNHDYGVYEHVARAARLFKEHGVRMIGVDKIIIDGVVFDGSPVMPISGYDPPFGFETEDPEREKMLGRIGNVDVLITHTPPFGILDRTAKGKNLGCEVLRTKIFEAIKPKLHCFGHVHEARGTHRQGGIDFMNASSNTRGTYVRDGLNGITHMTMSVRGPFVYDIEASA
jgi:predicted phosphohydrolase